MLEFKGTRTEFRKFMLKLRNAYGGNITIKELILKMRENKQC